MRCTSLILAIATAAAGAQSPARPAPAANPGPSLAAFARADSLYFAGRPADALAAYDSILARTPNDFDVLIRASRAALALGFLADRQRSEDPMYLRAEALARTAAQLQPYRVEGPYWLSAALGRRALFADLLPTIRLAKAVYESGTRALAIDSLHAGAHNVIGKLHSEVRNLPAFYRFVAGRFLGVSVARNTSWELAERHLRRAVELDSTMSIYRLDLGQLYMRTGRMADAARVLRAVAALPRIHPPDARFQREAAALLATATAAIQP